MIGQFALDANGRMMGYTGTVTGAQFVAGQAYLMNAACVTTANVDSSDTYNGGFRYASTGALRVYDATAGIPAGSNTNQGITLTSDGQVCITTGAVGSGATTLDGLRLTGDGRVYTTLLSPAAWYRYDVGITSANSLVSAWADQSGNGRHLVQTTDTNKPTLDSDGSILFDGSDNYMATAGFTLNQPTTLYVLYKPVSFTGNDRILDGAAVNSGGIIQSNADPKIRLNAGTNTAEIDAVAVGSFGVICVVFNGASSVFQVGGGSTTTGLNPNTGNMGGITLAANGAVVANYGNIAVKELIAFAAAHDAATRSRVLRYGMQVGGL